MSDWNAHYQPLSPTDAAALVAAHPLAWIVSRDFKATVLPLLAEVDEAGELRALLGHFARRNPQIASLRADPAALILFQGPHGYVPPGLVSQPRWGPTWNYAVLRIEADLAFVPEKTDPTVRQLVAHLEPDEGWTVERMGERYDKLIPRVIAFRAEVRSVEATFKLGQDETDATFEEIVAGHVDPALAELMRRQRPKTAP